MAGVSSPAPSRRRTVVTLLLVAVVPALLALHFGGDRLGALLAVMWLALVGTIAVAVLLDRPQKPDDADPRGRLYR